MAQDTINNDLYVVGNISAKSILLPPSTVQDSMVINAAGIQATKLQHQYEPVYQQESSTLAVSEQRTLFVVRGATATIVDLKAGAVVANIGAATVTVDLLKNGTTILTATISLTSSQTAYQQLTAAGFTSTSLVQGDVLEIKTTATAGGGTLAKGVFASLRLREDAN